MPATALLKFAIDAVDGPNGHAAELVFADLPKDVVVKNSNNTGVGSWQLDLLYSPPGATQSATLELAFADDGLSPLNFTLHINMPGTWRLMLKVWSGANRTGAPTDIDIRNVLAKTTAGFHIPPPQVFPLPLPSLSSGLPGAKPNEVNLGGREDLGWAGNDSDGLLNHFLRVYVPGTGGGGAVLDRTRYVSIGAAVGGDGSVGKPFATLAASIADLPSGGVILVGPGDYSAETITWVSDSVSYQFVALGGLLTSQSGGLLEADAPVLPGFTLTSSHGGHSPLLFQGIKFQSSFDTAGANVTLNGCFNAYVTAFFVVANGGGAVSLENGTNGYLNGVDITGVPFSCDAALTLLDCNSGGGTISVTFASPGTCKYDAVTAALAGGNAPSVTNGVAVLLAAADPNLFIEIDLAKGASFTIALTDLYKKIRLTAALTITVPKHSVVPLPVGIRIPLLADVAGTGQVVVAPVDGSVTISKAPSFILALREQGSPAELWQRATDVWWLFGDLAYV